MSCSASIGALPLTPELMSVIEQQYDICIKKAILGPQQFVATTYIIEDVKGHHYFCKMVDKPLLIPGIIDTLPAVEEMAKHGVEKICYPIRGFNGLYFFHENVLGILFNYIHATRALDYSVYELGKQIATVHAITEKMKVMPPKEDFIFPHYESFITIFEQTLVSINPDPVIQELKKILKIYENEIRQYIDEILKVASRCQQSHSALVLTHGDLATNILMNSPTDITIIDWDEMRLAPRERDLWMKDDEPEFLAGYKSIIPEFTVNQRYRRFFILQYYFERMHFYFNEVVNVDKSIEERRSLLERLAQNRMAGRNLLKLQERVS